MAQQSGGRHEIDAVTDARQAAAIVTHPDEERVAVAIVGAGPCGIAAAIALTRAGISNLVLERGCLVSGIYSYPTFMTFFSTAERLSIGNIPFSVPTDKPTRRDALAYYRTVTDHYALDVRQYETVERVDVTSGTNGAEGADGARFRLHSRTQGGRTRRTDADAVVIATGYFGHPNRLGVPGESLPHVSHLFADGHVAFDLPVVVVGGGNSAVDAALDLYRAGARVTLVHFGAELDRNVKPWVMPDITNRIKEGSIAARFGSRVVAIEPEAVVVRTPIGDERLPAAQVYPMLGYQPNNDLLVQLGVPIDAATGIPAHDPATMETVVPGVYMAGVLASGYDANKTFIENGRHHGDLIAARLVALHG